MKKDVFKKLMLALMYEASWKEYDIGDEVTRTWKGYPFDMLNELEEDELIHQKKKSKSVTFSDKGKIEAIKVLDKLKELDFYE